MHIDYKITDKDIYENYQEVINAICLKTGAEKEVIVKFYRDHFENLLYEGMSMWVQIQYLYLLNEVSYAVRLKIKTGGIDEKVQKLKREGRGDPYGIGFKMMEKDYKLEEGPAAIKNSPFSKQLHPEGDKEPTWPADYINFKDHEKEMAKKIEEMFFPKKDEPAEEQSSDSSIESSEGEG